MHMKGQFEVRIANGVIDMLLTFTIAGFATLADSRDEPATRDASCTVPGRWTSLEAIADFSLRRKALQRTGWVGWVSDGVIALHYMSETR